MLPLSIGLKVLSFFTNGGINNVIEGATSLYKAKLDAGESHDKLAADLAARQMQLDARDADLQAQLTRSGVFSPREVMGYAVAFYLTKILVWDKSLHLGVTDALDDRLWWIVTTVVIAYFGTRAIRDVTAYIRGR